MPRPIASQTFRTRITLFFFFLVILVVVENFTSFFDINIVSNNVEYTFDAVNNISSDRIEQLVNKKRKSLSAGPKIDCFCPNGRMNWIYYTNCPGRGSPVNKGAGIILRYMLWYADELCANVALLCTPQEWLSELHGCFAPQEAGWGEYFTPMRISGDTQESRVDFLYWDINESETFRGLTRIDGTPSIEQYELGRKMHEEGSPFVWMFGKNFWSTDLYTPKHNWPNQELSHRKYTDSCGIVDFDTSEEILNVGHLTMQLLNLTYSHDFITLHLRRGDIEGGRCDTRPGAVMKYLNCSMNGDDVKNVVVLTNGQDWYLELLKNTFTLVFLVRTSFYLIR